MSNSQSDREIKFSEMSLNPSKILSFPDADTDMWAFALRSEPHLLKHLKDQTNQLCAIAFLHDPTVLPYVLNKSLDFYKLIIRDNPLCLMAVNYHAHSLLYVKEQTREMCFQAISKNSETWKHVRIVPGKTISEIWSNLEKKQEIKQKMNKYFLSSSMSSHEK
jgi:hypothetical protein